MLQQKENVFIAWGGNYDMAKMVGTKISRRGFKGIVGGDNPTEMYVSETVFSQINQCTRAIILVEAARKDTDNPFSSNLMLEWGLLVAKKRPSKLHVFLIGVSRKDLPSDLLGIWSSEVKVYTEKTREQIAEEIVDIFCEKASQPIYIDKLDVFRDWVEIKRNFSIHITEPVYSEVEYAHYLLHSMEACYYYEEQDSLLAIIDKIKPASDELKYVTQMVKANIKLFKESSMLLKVLPSDTYLELKSFFNEVEPTFASQDINLSLWLQYFRYDRLCLLDMIVIESGSEQNGFNKERKQKSFSRIVKYSEIALQTLKQISEAFPKEHEYTKLYEGYIFRNLYKCYMKMSELEKTNSNIGLATEYYEKAGKYANDAEKARRIFYYHYKDHYASDGFLIRYFADEYYLSCAERHNFLIDSTDIENENAIKTHYAKYKNERGRLHTVKLQFIEVYRNIFGGK